MSSPARSRILLSVTGYDPKLWKELLSAEHDVITQPDGEPIDYAVVWKHPYGALDGLTGLKAIFSLGAGVDHIFADPGLPDVPIARIVADNLTRHMVEYMTWRVLDHHRNGMTYRANQAQKIWREPPQPVAGEISVGIMGLGQLGRACASALLALGFKVNGWTRTPRPMEGVRTFDGDSGLRDFLAATDILVVLLPHTPATEGIIDHALLRGLRRENRLGGAILINGGRGKLQKEADILQALDDGTLKEASLDVFQQEPLPPQSPLWTHPHVFVTPHSAATSDPVHLAPLMLKQIARHQRGEALQNLVDRAEGY